MLHLVNSIGITMDNVMELDVMIVYVKIIIIIVIIFIFCSSNPGFGRL